LFSFEPSFSVVQNYALQKSLVVLLLLFVVTLAQNIYSYIPETNGVSRVNNVAAIL